MENQIYIRRYPKPCEKNDKKCDFSDGNDAQCT